jgi:alkylation response protein AidB-like acyl-CoA dehydrogenase
VKEFWLSDAQRAVRELAGQLARDRIAPQAAHVDETESYPGEQLGVLAAHGLAGLWIPEACGGGDAGVLTFCLVVEEIARACASTAVIFLVQFAAGYPLVVAGTEGQKRRYLERSRPAVAAQAVGIAQAALAAARDYARERQQFGQPIANFQGVQFMLADMAMHVHAARLMVHHAAALIDHGAPSTALESSMAKCFASDAAMRVTTDAVQVFGGYGYTREFPVERFMRDAKITQIYEGTNQIQRLVIARELGLGRGASRFFRNSPHR